MTNEESKYTCSLCGHVFVLDGRSCRSSCPMSRHCNLVCCPNCGFSFPKSSRIVDLFKRFFKDSKFLRKIKGHEIISTNDESR